MHRCPGQIDLTLPFVQIGSVPTPWPSWLIAAHPERAPAPQLSQFLDKLSTYVRSFDSAEKRSKEDIQFIKTHFGYAEDDIKVRYLPLRKAKLELTER